MQKVELFLNAGDFDKQSNFIIRPRILTRDDLEEVLDCIWKRFQASYKEDGIKKCIGIEHYLKRNNLYPDPTNIKLTSEWFYDLVKKGSIMFRFGYDGRKETGTNRYNISMEGAFLKNVDIEKSILKYQKLGMNIIDEVGSSLPDNIEELLILRKRALFEKMKRQYTNNHNLESLFNHFYVACDGKEIAITQNITVPPLESFGLFGNTGYAKKKMKTFIHSR